MTRQASLSVERRWPGRGLPATCPGCGVSMTAPAEPGPWRCPHCGTVLEVDQ